MAFNPLEHPIMLRYPARVKISAWTEHVPFGMFLMSAMRPKCLVELGTEVGVSYCGFCQAAQELALDVQCHAVDTWQGDAHTGPAPEDIYTDLRAHHDPLYAEFSTLHRCTFDEALKDFADGSIDLLHIDGYHTYEAVRHDYETWLPKVSERGLVIFHDTNVREKDFGVWKYWDEIRQGLPNFEFLHGFGLGVLAPGTQVPADWKSFSRQRGRTRRPCGNSSTSWASALKPPPSWSRSSRRTRVCGAMRKW